MPVKRRISLSGYVYHVFTRAAEGRSLLSRPGDGRDLEARLASCVACAGITLYAWCLLPSRLHLLLRTGDIPLPVIMRRMLSGFARSVNARSGSSGSLFVGRYSAVIVEEQRYLLSLVRDIHALPAYAGLVDGIGSLEEWRWSGHRALAGVERRDWIDTVLVPRMLSQRLLEGGYREFMSHAASAPSTVSGLGGGGIVRSSGLSGRLGGHDPRTLGSRRFTQKVLREARRSSGGSKGCDEPASNALRFLVERAAEAYRISPDSLGSGSRNRQVTSARAVVCHLASKVLGLTYAEISEEVGIGVSSVAKAAERGRSLARAYPSVSSSLTRFISQSRK